jgi:HAD superfamily hydrolase (TIGR01509 family)
VNEEAAVIRGLIFDFDGLILDTEMPVYQSWVSLYRSFNMELPFGEWAGIIGTSSSEHFDPFDRLEAQLGRSLDRTTLAEQRRAEEQMHVMQQPILPGVKDLISEAESRGLKLGVASSSTRSWVEGHLTRLGLVGHFAIILTAEDVPRTKPDPALFRLALERLGLGAGEAVVLEDSPNGVSAAKAAGIFTVAVPNPLTAQLDLSRADMVVKSLADVSLDALLRWGRW